MSRTFYALTAAAWAAFFYSFPYDKFPSSTKLLEAPQPWSFFDYGSNMTQASATPSPMLFIWPVVGPTAATILSRMAPVTQAAETAWANVQPSATAFADSAKQVWIFMTSMPTPGPVSKRGVEDGFGLFVVCIFFVMGYMLLSQRTGLAQEPYAEEYIRSDRVYYLKFENVDNLKTQDMDTDVLTLRNGKRILRNF